MRETWQLCVATSKALIGSKVFCRKDESDSPRKVRKTSWSVRKDGDANHFFPWTKSKVETFLCLVVDGNLTVILNESQ